MEEIKLPQFPKLIALDELQAKNRAGARRGIMCDGCGSFVKIYRRKITSGVVASLIWLVTEFERNGGKWINVPRRGPRHVLANRELGRLVHWGLVEKRAGEKERGGKKPGTGLWAPTPLGLDFVFERASIPAWVDLFHNQVVGASTDMIRVREALHDKFDYDELMGPVKDRAKAPPAP